MNCLLQLHLLPEPKHNLPVSITEHQIISNTSVADSGLYSVGPLLVLCVLLNLQHEPPHTPAVSRTSVVFGAPLVQSNVNKGLRSKWVA